MEEGNSKTGPRRITSTKYLLDLNYLAQSRGFGLVRRITPTFIGPIVGHRRGREIKRRNTTQSKSSRTLELNRVWLANQPTIRRRHAVGIEVHEESYGEP